jgi:hypothetical protein
MLQSWPIFLVCFILAVLIFMSLFFGLQVYYGLRGGFIVFVPSLSRALETEVNTILHACETNHGRLDFVELGCGLANVSAMVEKKWGFKKIEGVELNPLLVMLSRLFLFFRKSRIKIVNLNVFRYQPDNPSIFYAYLSTPILDKLHQSGFFQGHLLICPSFRLSAKTPDQRIVLGGFYKELNVYDFTI